jgi:hypothetical protein
MANVASEVAAIRRRIVAIRRRRACAGLSVMASSYDRVVSGACAEPGEFPSASPEQS